MQVVDIQAFSAIGSAEELPPRIRADTRGLRPVPRGSAGRPPKIFFGGLRRTFGGLRADTGGFARTPRRTGGRVHSINVRRQKPPLHHGSTRKNFRRGRPSAAEIIVGSGLGLGLGLWYSNPNPNPNPDPNNISAADDRPSRKLFREEQRCKISICRRTFFE